MSPAKFDFRPKPLPDGKIKATKPYLEWLQLSKPEMEMLARFTLARRFANADQPAFWIFTDDLVVRTILKMDRS